MEDRRGVAQMQGGCHVGKGVEGSSPLKASVFPVKYEENSSADKKDGGK